MRNSFAIISTVVMLSIPSALRAQSYSIDWYTIAGGGGVSSGTNGSTTYTVTGTIGQPAASTMSGGNYSLTGGFWSLIAAVQTPGSPPLTITRSGNQAVISWPAPATGFVLEFNPNLSSPGWSPASATLTTNGGVISTTVSVGSGTQFYRLHNP